MLAEKMGSPPNSPASGETRALRQIETQFFELRRELLGRRQSPGILRIAIGVFVGLVLYSVFMALVGLLITSVAGAAILGLLKKLAEG